MKVNKDDSSSPGADVGEVVHGDDVDDGAHHARRVLVNTLKHRLLKNELVRFRGHL